jgi:hypothetical protein
VQACILGIGKIRVSVGLKLSGQEGLGRRQGVETFRRRKAKVEIPD